MSETHKDVPSEVAIGSSLPSSQGDSMDSILTSVSSGGMENKNAYNIVEATTRRDEVVTSRVGANGSLVSSDTSASVKQEKTTKEEEVSSTTSTTALAKLDKETDSELAKGFIELLRYVAISQETQKNAKNVFTKDFESEPREWTDNHFSKTDNQGKDCNVFFTSYEWYPIVEKLGWPIATEDKSVWFKLPCLRATSSAKPAVTDDTQEDIKRYLAHVRNTSPERFKNCEDLNNMIPLLTSADIPQEQPGWEMIREFFMSAVEHSNSESSEKWIPIYEQLHKLCNADMTNTELVLGIGHVRLVYMGKNKDKEPQSKIVNGPLFEVPMQVKLHRGENESNELWIGPTSDAKVTFNMEVMSAIITGGGGNSHYIDHLYSLAEKSDVSSMRLDNVDSYLEILRAARDLSCRGEIRDQRDPNVHVPKDLKAMVLTDGWCLLKRPKKSTVFSIDARDLIDAFEQGKLSISEPIRALLSGPEYMKKYFEETSEQDRKKENRLVFTLPVSESQRLTVERLLLYGEPVRSLEGPPGTGKTHSVVNVAATALSEGLTVIVTSSNPRALRAFLEKLPRNLRNLALDMSCCKEEEIMEFQQALETLHKNLQRPKQGPSKEKLQKHIDQKKEKLRALLEHIQSANKIKRDLMDNDNLKEAFQLALGLSTKAQWFLKIVWDHCLNFNGGTVIAGMLESIKEAESISFGTLGDYEILDDDELLKLVEKKATEVPVAPQSAASTFCLQSAMTDGEKKLSSVKLGGREPKTPAEWQCVLAAAKFRKVCAGPLRDCDCNMENIFSENGASFFRDRFSSLARDGLEVVAAINPLSQKLKEGLQAAVERDPSGRRMQDQCRELAKEIRELEGELLYAKVVAALKAKLDDNALSKLKQLSFSARNLKSKSMESQPTTGRSNRHFEEFIDKFKEVAKFMPFLVMTLDQVSRCLPPDHSWDIGIIDETSQSDCTAVNFVARCKRVLAVGDDKQVSPSQVALSEERVRSLKTLLPGFATAEQLLPEYSFFDLVQASFPKNAAALSEHYRCVPEIIAISNSLWYFSELNPLRLAGGPNAIRDHDVREQADTPKVKKGKKANQNTNQEEGEKEKTAKGKKTNQVEAEWITDEIRNEIRASAESASCRTIGVISLGGPDQCKLINNLIDQKLDLLIEEFGDDVVERHKILVGTPKEFQGDERDVIYLSLVHIPNVGKKGQSQKMSGEKGDKWKEWNVALTRAKDEMVLCRSYGIKDLKTCDVRQKILRKISRPWKGEEAAKSLMVESFPLGEKLELALLDALKGKGYNVEKNLGCVWNDTLCINSRVLICLENAGESEEEWQRTVDQQQSLEGAGRACLRVDCLEMVCDFDAVFQDVLDFLVKSGLPKPKRSAEGPDASADASAAKKPRAS